MSRSFGGIFGTYKALKALDIKADCLTVVNKNSKKILKKLIKVYSNLKQYLFPRKKILEKQGSLINHIIK